MMSALCKHELVPRIPVDSMFLYAMWITAILKFSISFYHIVSTLPLSFVSTLALIPINVLLLPLATQMLLFRPSKSYGCATYSR